LLFLYELVSSSIASLCFLYFPIIYRVNVKDNKDLTELSSTFYVLKT